MVVGGRGGRGWTGKMKGLREPCGLQSRSEMLQRQRGAGVLGWEETDIRGKEVTGVSRRKRSCLCLC